MSYPETGDGVSAQMLLKISDNVATLVTDVAVIKSQMASGEYERRIHDLEMAQAQVTGGRDVLARVVAGVGVAAAIGAAVATYAHH